MREELSLQCLQHKAPYEGACRERAERDIRTKAGRFKHKMYLAAWRRWVWYSARRTALWTWGSPLVSSGCSWTESQPKGWTQHESAGKLKCKQQEQLVEYEPKGISTKRVRQRENSSHHLWTFLVDHFLSAEAVTQDLVVWLTHDLNANQTTKPRVNKGTPNLRRHFKK